MKLLVTFVVGATTLLVSSFGHHARASDLLWQVESPFRFFKNAASFAMYERGYPAARNGAVLPPADVVWRTERRLNDPDCTDKTSPTSCADTARAGYHRSRLGWAAQTIDAVCYDSRQGRYLSSCDRRYSWGTAKEDYVLPDAHTVVIRLTPDRIAEAGAGDCAWSWTPRRPGSKAETRTQSCASPLKINRLPFSVDRNLSGATVQVALPGGRMLNELVAVEDLFIVALGDSFASGESNPDVPVTFSAVREMVYDPTLLREEMATRSTAKSQQKLTPAAPAGSFDYKNLPRRKLSDEEQELYFPLASAQFEKAFNAANPRWLSPDCHRSQYGYPFRVGLQMAMENPHRSVTLVSLACTGAEITEGLFLEKKSREGAGNPMVRSQLDQLADLICRSPQGRTQRATYNLPTYASGSVQVANTPVSKAWCAPSERKRPIDTLLLSIGGNDVGFSPLMVYAMTETAGDLAPIASLLGKQIRFSPQVSRAYMEQLDERMVALRDALRDGFGVQPANVLQTAYEPIQFDETGAMCGALPTLGLDVHKKLALSRERLAETVSFLNDFFARTACITNARSGSCPVLATGAGTGFRLITDHQPEFTRRGLCARDPKRPQADGEAMAMPRRWFGKEEFTPYSPAAYLPYASRWRLFRTPNDAFLTANVHATGFTQFDILQPVYAAMYSGAVHPTAEGHAIVADHVVRHVRALVTNRR
ncbi:hypothetical protein E0H22_16875 [Rhodopseudomonas boonkerdii]|uniref:hypothetical protein n=1 Tax=Rhodopseudomonas boonkerdii TaxID=475937 RepID=UPI001E526942|nr:hypothetical protein [Rhodopseudomonas boonkerdii]UGV27212.1 hypothetical protein E0H22_16875 [Rhodopseudomonas boonkerdii]